MQKLWNSAVLHLPADAPAAEVEASLGFLAEMCHSDFLDKAKLSQLIHGNTSWRPTHSLSLRALEHIYEILVHCNRFIRDTSSGDTNSDEQDGAPPKGDMIGMGFVFIILLDAQDEMVARKAAHMLVMMYISYAQSWNGYAVAVCLCLLPYLHCLLNRTLSVY